MMDIEQRLISWYLDHKRNLPWRETKDPYFIWLSEIILQQTRVNQGINYYNKFTDTYPNIELLAAADEEEVLKLWQGLGYYSRARNLLKAAKQVVDDFGGKFPDNYKDVLSLKGVGPYTAAAIVSFAYQIPKAVVDGNVNRVISRLYDIDIAVDSTEGKKKIQQIADALISQKHPDLFNQGIMELGAMICNPTNPSCENCPLMHHCMSKANQTIHQRPVKLPKRKPVARELHYIVLDDGDSLIMKSRKDKDIWQGLWDFPEISFENEPSKNDACAIVSQDFENLKELEIASEPVVPYKHILTHQHISAYFWRFSTNENIVDNSLYLRVPKAELESLAVPRLIHKFFIDFSFIN